MSLEIWACVAKARCTAGTQSCAPSSWTRKHLEKDSAREITLYDENMNYFLNKTDQTSFRRISHKANLVRNQRKWNVAEDSKKHQEQLDQAVEPKGPNIELLATTHFAFVPAKQGHLFRSSECFAFAARSSK